MTQDEISQKNLHPAKQKTQTMILTITGKFGLENQHSTQTIEYCLTFLHETTEYLSTFLHSKKGQESKRTSLSVSLPLSF